jgi:hypothetical protein
MPLDFSSTTVFKHIFCFTTMKRTVHVRSQSSDISTYFTKKNVEKTTDANLTQSKDTKCCKDSKFSPLNSAGLVTVHDVAADGNCLFSALSDQISYTTGASLISPQQVRAELILFLKNSGETDFDVDVRLAIETAHGDFDTYVNKMSCDKTWGDGIMLNVASKYYKRLIIIHDANGSTFTIGTSDGQSTNDNAAIHLEFAKDHYRSLRIVCEPEFKESDEMEQDMQCFAVNSSLHEGLNSAASSNLQQELNSALNVSLHEELNSVVSSSLHKGPNSSSLHEAVSSSAILCTEMQNVEELTAMTDKDNTSNLELEASESLLITDADASDHVCTNSFKAKRKFAKRNIAQENRLFKDEWKLKYFCIARNDSAVCLICNFSTSVFKEYNVKRHYLTCHKDWNEKYPPDSMIRTQKLTQCAAVLNQQQRHFMKAKSKSEAFTTASYKIAWKVAVSSKPFIDGELIKECMNIACETLYPDKPEIKQKMSKIPLSRNTVADRIHDCSLNVREQSESEISRCHHYSLAIDESNDIQDTAQLTVFIRYIVPEFEIKEELLGLISLKGTTTGKMIKNAVAELLNTRKINPQHLTSITTDGAPSMCGKENGAVALLRNTDGFPKFLSYHCFIHQQVLCAKHTMFKDVMTVVVDIVCFIRAKALNHRQFKVLLEELDSTCSDVLLHCEVRWLSRGRVLERFSNLLPEIRTFLVSKNKACTELSDPLWLLNLAFLTDMTGHLNVLNKQLQGEGKLLPELYMEVEAFKRKLILFSAHLSTKNVIHFPVLSKTLCEVDPKRELYNGETFVKFIDSLANEFEMRFSECHNLKSLFKFVVNPLSTELEHLVDFIDEQELAPAQIELLELQEDLHITTSQEVHSHDCVRLWKMISSLKRYTILTDVAKKVSSMFGSTYKCESAFSYMKLIKSKYRNRLTDAHLEDCIRAATTTYEPCFVDIVSSKQCQESH